LAASAALFALILGGSLEITLRLGGWYADKLLINTEPGPDGKTVFDPEVGHVLAPNVSGICRRTEFTYPVQSNSLGFRDDELPPVKDSEELRLWVLGDSVAVGNGVREEDRFTEKLEEILNAGAVLAARGGRRIRVVNSAVSGYGTWHEAYLMERFFGRVSPDAVLLDFTTSNDFRNNVNFARWKKNGGRYYMASPPASPSRAFLRDHLHVYHLLGALKRWESRTGSVDDEERIETLRALKRVGDDCAERGVPLTVAVLGTLETSEDLDDPRSYQASSYRTALEVLREGGYRIVDTVAAIRARGGFRDLFFPIDTHPNAAGHAFLASILAGADLIPGEHAGPHGSPREPS